MLAKFSAKFGIEQSIFFEYACLTINAQQINKYGVIKNRKNGSTYKVGGLINGSTTVHVR